MYNPPPPKRSRATVEDHHKQRDQSRVVASNLPARRGIDLKTNAFRGVTGSRATIGSVTARPYVAQDSGRGIRPERRADLEAAYTSWNLLDFADVTRSSRSSDFIRWQRSSKFWRGPFQRRSSTVSKTGTSSRRVARFRNNRASFHALNSDSASRRAFRTDGCHSRQSFGMFSRWGY